MNYNLLTNGWMGSEALTFGLLDENGKVYAEVSGDNLIGTIFFPPAEDGKHTLTTVDGVLPTCEEAGFYGYSYCTAENCGYAVAYLPDGNKEFFHGSFTDEVKAEVLTIAKTGHNFEKEIKFTPNIGENDYAFKMRNAKKFLAEGNKVKFTIRFRGREMSYQDLGADVLNRAAQDVADIAKTEGQPKLEGRNMSLMVSPTK